MWLFPVWGRPLALAHRPEKGRRERFGAFENQNVTEFRFMYIFYAESEGFWWSIFGGLKNKQQSEW